MTVVVTVVVDVTLLVRCFVSGLFVISVSDWYMSRFTDFTVLRFFTFQFNSARANGHLSHSDNGGFGSRDSFDITCKDKSNGRGVSTSVATI